MQSKPKKLNTCTIPISANKLPGSSKIEVLTDAKTQNSAPREVGFRLTQKMFFLPASRTFTVKTLQGLKEKPRKTKTLETRLFRLENRATSNDFYPNLRMRNKSY